MGPAHQKHSVIRTMEQSASWDKPIHISPLWGLLVEYATTVWDPHTQANVQKPDKVQKSRQICQEQSIKTISLKWDQHIKSILW